MKRSRLVRYTLALLLLSVVYAGFYLYQNLPELLQTQVRQQLQQYGVREFEYASLQVSPTSTIVDALQLRGDYAGFNYQASLDSVELHYHWRTLLLGNAQSLSLGAVNITITQTTAADNQPDTELIDVEELLPQRLLAQLPVDELQIETWQLDYQTLTGSNVSIYGALSIDPNLDLTLNTSVAGAAIHAGLRADLGDDTVALNLSLRDANADIAMLSANLAPANTRDWEWQIRGELHYAPLLTWLRELDTEQTLALSIPSAQTLTLHGETEITARIGHPNTLDLAAAPELSEALLRQFDANIHVSNDIHRLDFARLIEGGVSAFDIEVHLEDAHLVSTLQPTTFEGQLPVRLLALPETWQQWLHWHERVPVVLEIHEPLVLAQTNDESWSVKIDNSSLTLGDDDSRFSAQKLNLDLTANGSDTAPIYMTTDINATVSSRLRKQTLPQFGLALKQQGTIEKSTVDLRISDIPESFHATLSGDMDIATGAANIHIKTHIEDFLALTSKAAPLLRHFNLLQDEFRVRTGTAHLDTTVTSKSFDSATWEQTSHLTLRQLSGNFNDYTFDDLDMTAHWEGITQWKTRQPVEISLAELNVGFPVRDTQLQVSLPTATPIATPTIRLERFTAGMFDGIVALASEQTQAWDFVAESNQITLVARDWQLGQLVALQQSDDIQASGTLEGEFPVTLSNGRIIIDNGFIRALPPGGSIRYIPDEESQALATSSSELALALELLSDFQYQTLNSDVQLDKAGNLLLGLSLSGNNPSQYEGQAIQFNINLEQNIDPLLQSLRLSDNLVKQIESGLN